MLRCQQRAQYLGIPHALRFIFHPFLRARINLFLPSPCKPSANLFSSFYKSRWCKLFLSQLVALHVPDKRFILMVLVRSVSMQRSKASFQNLDQSRIQRSISADCKSLPSYQTFPRKYLPSFLFNVFILTSKRISLSYCHTGLISRGQIR